MFFLLSLSSPLLSANNIYPNMTHQKLPFFSPPPYQKQKWQKKKKQKQKQNQKQKSSDRHQTLRDKMLSSSSVSSAAAADLQPKTSLKIKQDDKFYRRLMSKETSLTNPSFRVYYGVAPGAVPFLWESCPGTPKNAIGGAEALPPLTPPPSYQSNLKKCGGGGGRVRRSFSKSSSLLNLILPRRLRKSSTPSSPSISSSSSSSSVSSSLLSPMSPTYFGEDDDLVDDLPAKSSTLCFRPSQGTSGGGIRRSAA